MGSLFYVFGTKYSVPFDRRCGSQLQAFITLKISQLIIYICGSGVTEWRMG